MKFLSNKIVWTLFLSVSVAGGFYYANTQNNKDNNYEYTLAARGSISEEVSVTGRVNPKESVELSLEVNGRVRDVYVEEGEHVGEGDVLLKIADSELQAQLSQYRASLAAQEAKLAELKAGVRPEEIKLQEIKIENAEQALSDTKEALMGAIEDSYAKSDDAIRNKVDQFISGPATDNPQLTFTLTNTTLEKSIESQRKTLEQTLNAWKTDVDSLELNSDITSTLSNSKDNLDAVKLFLDDVALAINSAAITATTGNTWKADVSAARTSVSAATSALLTAEKAYNSAASTVSAEEGQLNVLKAPPTKEQIDAQEAQVRLASAQVQNALAQISKTTLRAPIAGTITDVTVKKGETVSLNTKAISMMSDSDFDIVANVPEADIAKVSLGNTARVTLDAYGNSEIFMAKVVEINPAETILEGVATYKTTLHFTEEDERIKSGMTANIDIVTQEKTDKVVIPSRAITTSGGERTVKVVRDGEIIEVEIKTGIRGIDGNVEVISGIQEGDKVITFIE